MRIELLKSDGGGSPRKVLFYYAEMSRLEIVDFLCGSQVPVRTLCFCRLHFPGAFRDAAFRLLIEKVIKSTLTSPLLLHTLIPERDITSKTGFDLVTS